MPIPSRLLYYYSAQQVAFWKVLNPMSCSLDTIQTPAVFQSQWVERVGAVGHHMFQYHVVMVQVVDQ